MSWTSSSTDRPGAVSSRGGPSENSSISPSSEKVTRTRLTGRPGRSRAIAHRPLERAQHLEVGVEVRASWCSGASFPKLHCLAGDTDDRGDVSLRGACYLPKGSAHFRQGKLAPCLQTLSEILECCCHFTAIVVSARCEIKMGYRLTM